MADSPDSNKPPQVNPGALSVEELARLLTAAGGTRFTVEQVRSALDAGMPVADDGRLNLVHVTAWLAREVQA